jgi:hypothetical protein
VPLLRSRQHVGQDILLARHGNHICATRYDRRRNCIVARLDDGTFDTAPNVIAPGVLPPRISSVVREDGPFLAKMCAVYLVFALLLVAGAVAVASNSPDLTAVGVAQTYMSPFQVPVR